MLAGCAPVENPEESARFDTLLAVEQVAGVLHATSGGIVLDITATPPQIATAAVAAVAVLDEREWPFDVTLVLYRPGVADSGTEFTFALDDPRERLQQRAELWANLVTSGFASVRMNLFGEGSEYGDGVISVEGWAAQAAPPSTAEAYEGILRALDGTGLEPSRMQVNVDLGFQLLNDDVSVPIADGLLDTVERLIAEWGFAYAAVQVEPELTTITLARGHDGLAWVSFTPDEAAVVRAELAGAGLLTPSLRVTGLGSEPVAIWEGA